MAHVFKVAECSADLVEGLLLLMGLRLNLVPVFICSHLLDQALAMHPVCAFMLYLFVEVFSSISRHPECSLAPDLLGELFHSIPDILRAVLLTSCESNCTTLCQKHVRGFWRGRHLPARFSPIL